jgi:hypothetical protein
VRVDRRAHVARTRAAVEKDLREMLHARHLKGLGRVTLTDSPTLALASRRSRTVG